MAEETILERTYNVPLRKEFLKVPKYKRAKKAVTALKQFLVKHMKSDNIKIGNKFSGNVANSVVSIGNDSGYIWCAYLTSDTWAQVSDRRLKKNIKDDDLGLAFINELKPVTFNWKSNEEIDPEFLASKRHKGEKKDTETTRHGFIAQDVKEAMDKVGNTTFNGWEESQDGQAVSREMFITPLVKAIQELSATVEVLKSEIETLKGG